VEHNPIMGFVSPITSYHGMHDGAGLSALFDDATTALLRSARILNHAALALALLALLCIYLKYAARRAEAAAYYAGEQDAEERLADELDARRAAREED